MRVYSTGPNQLRYESKFLKDGLQVSLQQTEAMWDEISAEKQLEFAIAFSAKPSWSDEDGEILEFLARVGNEYVVQTITNLIAQHFERKRAANFFLGRIERSKGFPLSNYYRALGAIGTIDLVPTLRQMHEQYLRDLNQNHLVDTSGNASKYVDYLYLCSALRQIDGSPEFEADIRKMLNHADERVRICAQRLLKTEDGHSG